MPHDINEYKKPAKSPNALLRHLSQRGLKIVGQRELALNALLFIGHYRLLIYMRPLQQTLTKEFYPGVTFSDVLSVYDFDRKLRILFLDAIERIEIAFRSAIINTLIHKKNVGPHFYMHSIHFQKEEHCRAFIKTAALLNPDKNDAARHYYKHYNTPSLPPIWMLLEASTIGTISHLFSGLHTSHRNEIAANFGYDETVLCSWLKSINVLRNACAHHNRLWNHNNLVNAPKYPKKIKDEFPPHNDRGRVAAKAALVRAILNEIDKTSDWPQRFKKLMTEFPSQALSKAGVDQTVMGFSPGWELRPFWA